MTVMSEGLLLNSKYIKMGREEGGFQAFLTQQPLVIVCKRISETFIRNRRQDGETFFFFFLNLKKKKKK